MVGQVRAEASLIFAVEPEPAASTDAADRGECGHTTTVISATITDDTAVDWAVVVWRVGEGGIGSARMGFDGKVWTGVLGPIAVAELDGKDAATISVSIAAVDVFGNVGISEKPLFVEVRICVAAA